MEKEWKSSTRQRNKILIIIMLLFILMPVKAIETKETEQEVLKPSLVDIKVNGESIKDFKSDKYEYELYFDKTIESVTIVPRPADGCKFSTEGSLNNHVLNPGTNIINIIVTNNDDNLNPQTYTVKIIKADDRSNDATLSSLTIGDLKVNLKENTYNYTVEVPNTIKSVEIKATLNNNKAVFVQGYGERIGNNSVNLSGEVTNIEVRVKAENGEIKAYKISIKKTDYKNNDATLKSLVIKNVDFNFKSNITSYNIEVDNEIDKINLEASPNDNKATVNYNSEMELKEGLNKITITVTAQDGTTKDYRLNITRKEKVNLVERIEIEGIDFEFEPDTYEYNIETTLTLLNFTVVLNDKEATYEVLNNENLKNGSIVKIVVKNKDSELTYNFKIVNEDEQEEEPSILNEDENKEEKEIKVNFLKKNEMLIGLLTFGVGLISMLFSVLTKFKNK